jgi:hypothetical protein
MQAIEALPHQLHSRVQSDHFSHGQVRILILDQHQHLKASYTSSVRPHTTQRHSCMSPTEIFVKPYLVFFAFFQRQLLSLARAIIACKTPLLPRDSDSARGGDVKKSATYSN